MAKILVLDDVLDAAVVVKKILERQQYEVVTFTDEVEALEYVIKHQVDLAILDIKLKKMSGVAMLEEFKKVNPGIKAIMLTGNPTSETARRALQLGASAYCLKPIEKNELEEKVRHVLAG